MSLKRGMRTELLIFLTGVGSFLGRIWIATKLAGFPERIALLCGAFSAISAETGIALPQPYQKYYQNALEVAQSNLSETAFNEVFARGQAMSQGELLACARQALAEI